LLTDTEGYKEKVKSHGGQAAVEKTVRKLKTAQSKKNDSSSVQDYKSNTGRKKRTQQRTVQRKNNMFKRF